MRIRALQASAMALCLGVAGCSSSPFKWTKGQENEASTYGIGDAAAFEGDFSPQEVLASRKFYFDFNRYTIQEEDYSMITAHANYLQHHPHQRVRVEGHADEQGSREYNIALGEKRAKAVANVLLSHGVSSQQIAVVSYGKEKPDVLGHTEEAHRLNRRAVIVYE